MRGFPNAAFRKGATAVAGMAYFAQRLEELTSFASLDSYKAPTVNVPTIIAEAIDQLKVMQEVPNISGRSLDAILDELRVRIQGNPVVKSVMPSERAIVDALSGTDISRLSQKLSVLSRELSQHAYIVQVMTLLIDCVEDNHKSTLECLVRDLATTLENIGMSRQHLNESTIDFFYKQKVHISGPNDLRRFYEIIFPHIHKFNLLFKVNSLVDKLQNDNFSAFDMSVITEIPEAFREASIGTDLERLTPSEKYILLSDLRAFDKYSAIRSGQKKVSLLQNLFRMYHHKATFELSNVVLVEQCCINGVSASYPAKSRMHFVNDDRPGKAAQRLDFLLKGTRLTRGSDRSKFYSITEFHGMSLEAQSRENQLLNIWISLETLVPSRKSSSKVDTVVKAILPIIGINYLRRLVERTALDLVKWNRKVASETLRLCGDSNGSDNAGRVLSLLALEDNRAYLEDLFQSLGRNELLRSRLYLLHMILKSPKNASSAIRDHLQRVEWQLRRIYRARNSIVHLGVTPSFLDSIVDNAHDYLDQVLVATCDVSCGINGFNTYEQCFGYYHWEFEAYMERLSQVAADPASVISSYLWKRRQVASRGDVLGRPLPDF